MSLQWEFVWCLLVAQMSFASLLVLPLPSSAKKVFIDLFVALASKLFTLVVGLVALLVFFLVDATREVWKLQDVQNKTALQLELMFRSQRNSHLCGFSLFMILILYGFYSLVREAAKASQNLDVLKKQAAANQAGMKALETEDKAKAVSNNKQAIDDEVKSRVAKQEQALKAQHSNLEKSYDELLDRYNRMEIQFKRLGGNEKDLYVGGGADDDQDDSLSDISFRKRN